MAGRGIDRFTTLDAPSRPKGGAREGDRDFLQGETDTLTPPPANILEAAKEKFSPHHRFETASETPIHLRDDSLSQDSLAINARDGEMMRGYRRPSKKHGATQK